MIRHVVHININVSDIERAVAFYRLLGFELMHVLADEPTDNLQQLMHFGGRTTRGAVMSLGDDPSPAPRSSFSSRWILRRSRKACFPKIASASRAWPFGPRT